MTGRPAGPAIALLVLSVATVPGCGADPGPGRVPDDGAPCSAMMPGPPRSGEETVRLGAISATERAWTLRQPHPGADPPQAFTTYVVRRGTVTPDGGLRDAALLDAVAGRVARGIALQEGTTPKVAKVPTDAGEAAEVRWTTGRFHNATRVLLSPGGYCEVTILGARAEADVAAYFASMRVRPGATP
jgi:hypothetical protein